MNLLRGLLLDACLGMLAGTAVADVGAPVFFNWYSIPGGGDAMCHCGDLVTHTTHAMVQAHLVAAGIGGVIFAVVGRLLRRGGAAPPRAAAPSPPP